MGPIYRIEAKGLAIGKEDFKPENMLRSVERAIERMEVSGNGEDKKCCAVLKGRQNEMDFYRRRLLMFARHCRKDLSGFVISHGDEGGNVIIDGGAFTIIDWDHMMLAPIERDIWMFNNGRKGQMQTIKKTLEKQGVPYGPDLHRLAYYTYFSYFFYLVGQLAYFFDGPDKASRKKALKDVEDYLKGWIVRPLKRADLIEP